MARDPLHPATDRGACAWLGLRGAVLDVLDPTAAEQRCSWASAVRVDGGGVPPQAYFPGRSPQFRAFRPLPGTDWRRMRRKRPENRNRPHWLWLFPDSRGRWLRDDFPVKTVVFSGFPA